MFILFKRKEKLPNIDSISIDVASEFTLDFSSLCNSINQVEVYNHVNAEKKKVLAQLGFKNGTDYINILRNEEMIKRNQIISIYKDCCPNSLFVDYNIFKSLIYKYKLVCGKAEKYVGEIPDKNLIEIKTAIDNINDVKPLNGSYIYPNSDIKIVTRIIYSSIIPDNSDNLLYMFPFVRESDEINIRKTKFYSIECERPSFNDIFIAATANMMKNNVEMIQIGIPSSLLRNDPIVFQILPYDVVMIHSKWV